MSEATVLVVDNSEWMRNGDYPPSRMDAQRDALLLLTDTKLNNAESTVSIISGAGRAPKVHVALTNDLGLIRAALDAVIVDGCLHFTQALSVGQLALKNRLNKQQKQRIVVFVGSPVEEETDELVKLAKKLKKNNCAVDIVSFGEVRQNASKLEAFIAAVNSSNAPSRLETLEPGSDRILSQWLMGGAIGGSGSGGMSLEETDPELAMALRLSLQEAQGGAGAGAGADGGAAPMDVDSGAGVGEQQGGAGSEFPANWDSMTEDEQIEYALRLSMMSDNQGGNNNQQ